jgi:HlyD family secretion protein
VSRTVDIGQTVAASLSAPELFRIAKNLREMQILASVDESDIGKIAVGQPVTFTVAAYAGRTFSGTTNQVRLLSSITDNVVN